MDKTASTIKIFKNLLLFWVFYYNKDSKLFLKIKAVIIHKHA
jgi:hypothetical protein